MKKYEKNLCKECTKGCSPLVYFHTAVKKDISVCSKFRVCNSCNEKKELSLFAKNKSNFAGVNSECKRCRSKRRTTQEYRNQENKRRSTPEQKKRMYLSFVKYKNKNKKKVALTQKKWFLKKFYGLSYDQYQNILKSQDNKCAICGLDQKNCARTFNVDHKHEEGKVRGILCNNCNTGIGLFKENEMIMHKAINYLIEHQGSNT